MQSPSASVEKEQQFTPPPPVASLAAKRNLRSASSTSSTGGESSVTTATVSSTTSQSSTEPLPFFLSTTSRYVKSIKPEVDLIATSTPQSNLAPHVEVEQEATQTRYDLRKRISPSVERVSPVRDTLAKTASRKSVACQRHFSQNSNYSSTATSANKSTLYVHYLE